MRSNRIQPRKRRRGLALVEVLICATVAALMLTATAVAFKASVQTYRDNNDRNMLSSQGRSAIRELVSEIRQCDAHGPINDTNVPNAITLFAGGQVIENGGIQMLKTQPDADEPNIVPGVATSYVLITWQYDPTNLQLLRTRTAAGATTSAVVASYVQDFKVRMEPARSAANVAAGNPSYDILLRAVITIAMQDIDASGKLINNQGSTVVTERLVDAAVPRKNFSGL